MIAKNLEQNKYEINTKFSVFLYYIFCGPIISIRNY